MSSTTPICFVVLDCHHNYDIQRLSTIDVPTQSLVAEVKELVKAAQTPDLDQFRADELILWAPNSPIPFGDANTLEAFLKDLNLDYWSLTTTTSKASMMIATCTVADYFSPDAKFTHFLVAQAPPFWGSASKRCRSSGQTSEDPRVIEETIIVYSQPPTAAPCAYNFSYTAPTILDGRGEAIGPPLRLYHPAIATFHQLFLDRGGLLSAAEFMRGKRVANILRAQGWPQSTEVRRTISSALDIDFLEGPWSVGSLEIPGYSSSTLVREPGFGGRALSVILGIKDGIAPGDPTQDAFLSYTKYYKQDSDLINSMRGNSVCPALIIGVRGSYITAHVAAFIGDHIVLEPLTDAINVCKNSEYTSDKPAICYFLRAARGAISAIEKSYNNLADPHNRVSTDQLSFPYVRSFTRSDGGDTTFSYVAALANNPSQVFEARLDDNDRTPVIVKFAYSYCVEAHQLLADHRYAPRLLHSQQVFPDMMMIVMDLVPGQVASSRFNSLPPSLSKHLRLAVQLLHENDFVFGDLRLQNIIIRDNVSVAMVDFDWAGKVNQARYPGNINPELVWHPSVEGGGLVEKAHDVFNLNRICSQEDSSRLLEDMPIVS